MKPSSLSSYTCAFMETFIDCSASMVPLCMAVMVGILIGWIWRPRWLRSVLLAIKSKPCNAWSSSGGLEIQRLWPTLNAVATHSIAKARCSKCSSMLPIPQTQTRPGVLLADGSGLLCSDTSRSQELVASKSPPKSPVPPNLASSAVGERDLLDLHRRLHGQEGGLPWDLMMERSAPGITYQAWRRDPQDGPIEYKSRTVFEDSNPELVKDFYWDDEFRLVWDDMVIYAKTLEECMDTGADIVHWVRKFPFFCSDREYMIGRRIFEVEGTFFCITKVVPYAVIPRRDKPLRVDTYYSSWCIRAAESMKNKGQMTACEVMFFHAEDMLIPKQIVKIGARQGMWGCVRKMEPALRKYQANRSTAKTLSQSARLAQLYTRMPPNFFEVCGSITPKESSDDSSENEHDDAARLNEVVKGDSVNQGHWRWLIVGGAVVLACTLDRGVLGRAVIFGLARRFSRVNQRLR